MICAEDEIGIGESHEGIMILNDKHKAGKKFPKSFKITMMKFLILD